jgi:hypothetical protein
MIGLIGNLQKKEIDNEDDDVIANSKIQEINIVQDKLESR